MDSYPNAVVGGGETPSDCPLVRPFTRKLPPDGRRLGSTSGGTATGIRTPVSGLRTGHRATKHIEYRSDRHGVVSGCLLDERFDSLDTDLRKQARGEMREVLGGRSAGAVHHP
jgi:hypothetical protein